MPSPPGCASRNSRRAGSRRKFRAKSAAGYTLVRVGGRTRRVRRFTGFAFIELAIVLTLVGILLTLVIATTQRFIQRARATATAAQMAFIRDALLAFAASCDGLPLSAESGGDPGLAYPPANTPCWTGPYLAGWPATTSFGGGTTYRYRGVPGSAASLTAQDLTPRDALSLGSEVARSFGGYARLQSGTARWSVTVTIGEYYQK